MRYDKNWSFCNDGANAPVKCLHVHAGRASSGDDADRPSPGEINDITLTLGGTLRSRAESIAGRPFGPNGPRDDQYILFRFLVDGEVKLGDVVSAHLQLGWHNQSGRNNGPAPTDKDEIDLRKAYIDVNPTAEAQIRIGRQELVFGSARLVSARDGPNIRRVFDGGLAAHRGDKWRVQAFAVRPVRDRPGAFDDRADQGQRFLGVYTTIGSDQQGIDLYYFDLLKKQSTFGSITAREHRRSLGLRVFGQYVGLDYNFELVGQNGQFGNKSVRAWTVASDTGFTFQHLEVAPRIGVKLNVTSGDENAADNTLQTFNPLFPNLAYFNEAALLAPQNHIDIHPSISGQLARNVKGSMGVNWFWKTTRADDIYRGPGIPVNAIGGSKSIGRQLDLNLLWEPTLNLSVKASYVHFSTGKALRAISGSATNFGMISLQHKF